MLEQGRQEAALWSPDTPSSVPQPVLDQLSGKLGEQATLEWLWGTPQKALGLKIDLKNLELLKQAVSQQGEVREVARLASLGLPRAGSWLLPAPIPALGLRLLPQEFTIMVRYRLGCKVYEREGPCPACHQPSDIFGDHALSCGHWGERITRHNSIRDQVHSMAATAMLNPVKEGRFILPGCDRRPADVYLPNWAAGRDTALDITVINPLQGATVEGAAAEPGYALDFAFRRKMTAVAEDCERQGVAFLPLAFESLGGWHKTAEKEVTKIAQALARQTGREESECSSHARSRISLLLMRGNASILLNRIPYDADPAVDGDL